ncbi:MAG: GntR family transcriptional regulator [Chthoniobacterales bacterium]
MLSLKYNYEFITMFQRGKNFGKLSRQPLYQQVKEAIVKSLACMKPGDRLPTEADYIKHFGVSITPVRQAIRELEQEGWIEKRQGSGTFLLDASARRHGHVAVLLDVDITSENLSPYWLKIVWELQKALEAEGFSARPYFGNLPLGTEADSLTCRYLLDDVYLNRVQGMIGFFIKRNPAWTELFSKKNIPVNDPECEWRIETSRKSTETFLRATLKHFRDRGCKYISTLTWESNADGRHIYSQLLPKLGAEYGFETDSRLMDITAGAWEQGMGWERFRDIWQSSRQKPDALIIGDDMLFADAQEAIQNLRISVPDELCVAVRSSDAVNLNPQFPIYNCQLQCAPQAALFAAQIKALIEGSPTPPPVANPYVQEFLLANTTSPDTTQPYQLNTK